MESRIPATLQHITESDTWVNLLAAGLLVIVPLAIYKGFADHFLYSKIFLTELMVTLGLTAKALVSLWGKVRASTPTCLRVFVPLTLFTFVVLASCFWSPVPQASFREAAYFVCGPLWAVLLISCGGSETRVRWISVLVTLTAAVVATIAILQWSGFDPLLWKGEWIEWGTMVARMRLYSTLGNPNFVAGYLVGAIFPALALAASLPTPREKVLCCAIVAVMFVAIVGEGSRGAWLGLAAGSLAAAFVWKRGRVAMARAANTKAKAARACGVVAVSLVGMVAIFLTHPANGLLRRIGGRWFLWRSSWPMVWEHPILGGGWGTFQLSALDSQASFLAKHPTLVHFWTFSQHLENDPLQLLIEIGLVGFTAFALVLGSFGRAVAQAPGAASARFWLPASAGGVTAILVDSLFNSQFSVPPTLLLLFTLLTFPALLEAAATKGRAEPPSASLPTEPAELARQRHADAPLAGPLKFRGLRILASLAILAAAGALAAQSIRVAAAERDYARALRLESAGQMDLSEQAYRHGLAADPLNGKLHFGLGRVLYFRHASGEARDQVLLAERTYRDSHLVVLEGRIEEQMGLAAEALETYRQALKLDPTLTGLQADIDRLERSSNSRKTS